MRSLNFDFFNPQVEINGTVFDLLKSDVEICSIAEKAQGRFNDVKNKGVDEVLGLCKALVTDIESIIGDGAVAKLSGGKPVGVVQLIKFLTVLASEGTKEYMDYIADEYLPNE